MIGALVVAVVLADGAPAHVHGIRWERNFEEGLRRARNTKKPVMVDFWAQWCGWCRRLEQTTYVDSAVVDLAGEFVPIKIEAEGAPKHRNVASRYGVSALPTVLFLTPSGRVVLRVSGFQGPGLFTKTLETAREKSGQVMAWEATLERDPDDAMALASLGDHMYRQDSYDEARRLLTKARPLDKALPSGKRKRVRMLLGVLSYYDRRHAECEAVVKEGLDIQPAEDIDAKLLYLLGRTYMVSGRPGEARKILQSLIERYPRSHVVAEAREALAALNQPPPR